MPKGLCTIEIILKRGPRVKMVGNLSLRQLIYILNNI